MIRHVCQKFIRFSIVCWSACLPGLTAISAGAAEPAAGREASTLAAPAQAVIQPGRETTYASGPLDPQGYVDFYAALNAELGRGVPNDQNAAIPLIYALGPEWNGTMEVQNLVLEALGEPAWQPGKLDFVGEAEFLEKLTAADQRPALTEQFAASRARPWAAAEFPQVMELLTKNADELTEIAAAVQRPRYFRPLVRQGNTDLLIAALLPDIQQYRDAARQFHSRAMLALNNNDLLASRNDLLTTHRLARLVSQGGTLIEGLVGLAIENTALTAARQWIAHPAQTTESIAGYRLQLAELPPMGDFVRQINIGERFMGLDAVQGLARGRPHDGLLDTPQVLGGVEAKLVSPGELVQFLNVLSLDWNEAMRTMNASYDEAVQLASLPNRADRLAAQQRLDQDLLRSREEQSSFSGLVGNLFGGSKYRGQSFGEMMRSLLFPAIAQVSEAHDRWRTNQQLLDVYLAARQYHCDHGVWPASLADLAAAPWAAQTTDLYSGQPFRYQIADDVVRFYSVGPNGIDDGGRSGQGKDDLVTGTPEVLMNP